MENEKNNTPKKRRGKKMYEIYCSACSRELTSKEIDYWKKAKSPESRMKCYYCLTKTAKIMQIPMPFDNTHFGRPELPIEEEIIEEPIESTPESGIPLDLSKAGFLKDELFFDPVERATVYKGKTSLAGPFGTHATHEKIENSNLKLTKISAIGAHEDVSLTLIVPGDIPKEFVPFLENGLNKFLAVCINAMAFAPLHSSVMKPFFKNSPDDNFDPGNMRFPWDN